MRAGAALTQREAIRQRLRDYALAHALDQNMTLRCRWANENGIPGGDHACARPVDSRTCICTCHDGRDDGQPVSAP